MIRLVGRLFALTVKTLIIVVLVKSVHPSYFSPRRVATKNCGTVLVEKKANTYFSARVFDKTDGLHLIARASL